MIHQCCSIIVFMKRIFALLLLAIVAISCSSVPTTVDPNLSKESFFKEAQMAFDEDNMKKALYYYEVFLIRYPDDHTKTIMAEYEIAFIYLKIGELDKAEELLNNILYKYDYGSYSSLYPPAYRRLAEMAVERLAVEREVQSTFFLFRRMKRKNLLYGETEEVEEIE